MATTPYSLSSAYAKTEMYGKFLDLMTYRPITKTSADKLYVIDKFYHLRPDILAYDLYQLPQLWWVFAVRNPNSIKDPVFDFVTGNMIYLPERNRLYEDLGI